MLATEPKLALLPKTHPTYLRRMARSLKDALDGFYYDGQRFTGASFTGGFLTITRPHDDGNPTHKIGVGFRNLDGISFSDPYGREICASRKTP